MPAGGMGTDQIRWGRGGNYTCRLVKKPGQKKGPLLLLYCVLLGKARAEKKEGECQEGGDIKTRQEGSLVTGKKRMASKKEG